MKSDFHMHTTYSDGAFTGKELVNQAINGGFTHISITDHDSIGFYTSPYGYKKLNNKGITIIPGVELSVMLGDHHVEVLAYGYDIELMSKIVEKQSKLKRRSQLEEFELYKENCIAKGFKIDTDAKLAPKQFAGTAIHHLIRANESNRGLISNDAWNKGSTFFRTCMSPGGLLHIDPSECKYRMLDLDEMVLYIKRAKGLAVLAHTNDYAKNDMHKLIEIGTAAFNAGVDSLELGHPSHNTLVQLYMLPLIMTHSKLNFLTGGSDFHGTPNSGRSKNIGDYEKLEVVTYNNLELFSNRK